MSGTEAKAIAPYRQGDLDSLCGLYAIINASRLALSSTKCIKIAEIADFFASLIARLHADAGQELRSRSPALALRLTGTKMIRQDAYLVLSQAHVLGFERGATVRLLSACLGVDYNRRQLATDITAGRLKLMQTQADRW